MCVPRQYQKLFEVFASINTVFANSALFVVFFSVVFSVWFSTVIEYSLQVVGVTIFSTLASVHGSRVSNVDAAND